jgi:hypothetical protein
VLPKDQDTFNLTVDAILSDLMHHHLVEHLGEIYVTRSNKVLGMNSRYRPRAYSKMFPYILDLMAKPEMAFVVQDIAPPVEGHLVPRSSVLVLGFCQTWRSMRSGSTTSMNVCTVRLSS